MQTAISVIRSRARTLLQRMGEVERVQIIKSDGSFVKVEGVFLHPHASPVVGKMMVSKASHPEFKTMAEDVSEISRGDKLLVNSKVYSVIVTRTDDRAVLSSLQLKEEVSHA